MGKLGLVIAILGSVIVAWYDGMKIQAKYDISYMQRAATILDKQVEVNEGNVDDYNKLVEKYNLLLHKGVCL